MKFSLDSILPPDLAAKARGIADGIRKELRLDHECNARDECRNNRVGTALCDALFTHGATPREVIEKAVSNFEAKWEPDPVGYYSGMGKEYVTNEFRGALENCIKTAESFCDSKTPREELYASGEFKERFCKAVKERYHGQHTYQHEHRNAETLMWAAVEVGKEKAQGKPAKTMQVDGIDSPANAPVSPAARNKRGGIE